MKIYRKIKKLLVEILTVLVVVFPTHPAIVWAEDVPTAPTAPTATTEVPTPPSAPEAPTAPTVNTEVPTPPSAPEAPTAPTPPATPNDTPEAPSAPAQLSVPASLSDTQVTGSEGSDTHTDGNVGNTAVNTGDVNSSSLIVNTGNSNLYVNPGNTGSGISTVNADNGVNTINNGSATVVNNNSTNQVNGASIGNNLNQAAVSGNSSTSFNVGDSSISTGNANSSGTVINSLNTNVDGIAVAEFNVVDNHTGDLVLDFNQGCVSGCGGRNVSVNNTGNGVNSDNNSTGGASDNNSTSQTNNANIGSDLTLVADSGNNKAIYNTGGDSFINTGDANVSANVLTFANNNLAGKVVYSVVNIYGTLIGDIVLTPEAMNAFCGNCLTSGIAADNSGNSAYSTNTDNASQTNNSNTSQFNNVDINNNLILSATTGDNNSSFNTDGNSAIQTGKSNVDASILNVANNNIDANGNVWLVLVNEAGRWFGQILGAPAGSTTAASQGIEFITNSAGEIVATNSGNGVGSVNTANANENNNSTISQTNNATINNNINLSANTGHNSTSFNTGGNSGVETGDATVVANIVNFVNNNIVGSGKLFVTVVNVFGNWLGDFVTPGTNKEHLSDTSAVSDTSSAQANDPGRGGASITSDISVDDSAAYTGPSPVLSVRAFRNVKKYSSALAGQIKDSLETKINEENLAAQNVLGSKSVQTVNANNKTIKINLAWLICLLPFVVIIRRRRLLTQFFIRSH